MNINLASLLSSTNTNDQAQALQQFNELLEAKEGLKVALCLLEQPPGNNSEWVVFFCLRLLEEFIKQKYYSVDEQDKLSMKKLCLIWFKNCMSYQLNEPQYVINKKAQLVSLLFTLEYPNNWPTFFLDLLPIINPSNYKMVQLYLSLLLTMNDDVMNKAIPRSEQELQRNTVIKDHMREDCVNGLVDSLYLILLERSYSQYVENVCSALKILGLYSQWIDISYVIHSRFLELFTALLRDEATPASVVECFQCILNKGMENPAKLELIELLNSIMIQSGLIESSLFENDFDLQYDVARYYNTMGNQMIYAFQCTAKQEQDLVKARLILDAIHNKFPSLCMLLGSEDDSVSESLLDFAIGYVSIMKVYNDLSTEEVVSNIRELLVICIKKLKYDESHCFQNEGEIETLFIDFRKALRVLLVNISMLLPQLMIIEIEYLFMNIEQNYDTLPYMEIELLLFLMYHAEESIQWKELKQDQSVQDKWFSIIIRLLNSSITHYKHHIVSMQYLELTTRLTHFLKERPEFIPIVLLSFLDERGIRNSIPQVRSRACFFLCKFLKTFKCYIKDLDPDVLNNVMSFFDASLLHSPTLDIDDLLFLYESGGILIIYSNTLAKREMFLSLFQPIIDKFSVTFQAIHSGKISEEEMQPLTRTLTHLMQIAGYASKSISSSQIAQEANCLELFMQLTQHFSKVLTIPCEQETFFRGLKTFLHRMVIVLGTTFLHYVPELLSQLLSTRQPFYVQEGFILINQIISHHSESIGPYLEAITLPCIHTLFFILENQNLDTSSEVSNQGELPLQELKKSYLILIHTIFSSNSNLEIFLKINSHSLISVLTSLTNTLIDYPCPPVQRQSSNALRLLTNQLNKFSAQLNDFCYQKLLPALFLTPSKQSFDLKDAQTILVLQDISAIIITLIDYNSDGIIRYYSTSYMPSLGIHSELIQQYSQILSRSDLNTKVLKTELIKFYSSLRSLYRL